MPSLSDQFFAGSTRRKLQGLLAKALRFLGKPYFKGGGLDDPATPCHALVSQSMHWDKTYKDGSGSVKSVTTVVGSLLQNLFGTVR